MNTLEMIYLAIPLIALVIALIAIIQLQSKVSWIEQTLEHIQTCEIIP